MIRADECMALILSKVPGFAEGWQVHLNYWEGEAAGLCNDMSAFSRYVVEVLQKKRDDDLVKIFGLVERLMVEGEEAVSTAAATCFVENLLNRASGGGIDSRDFLHLLGPESRAYAIAWDVFSGVPAPIGEHHQPYAVFIAQQEMIVKNWEIIAALAWWGYQNEGPGVVVFEDAGATIDLERPRLSIGDRTAVYVSREILAHKGMLAEHLAAEVNDYKSREQALVMFLAAEGDFPAYLVGVPGVYPPVMYQKHRKKFAKHKQALEGVTADVLSRKIARKKPAQPKQQRGPTSMRPPKTTNEPKKGKITYNEDWDLTPSRQRALERLAELGVDVYSSIGKANYTLMIPHTLMSPLYIEIGYLIAQLDDEAFPVDYEVLSAAPTSLDLPKLKGRRAPVEFTDSYPHGLKYRVYPREERE